MVITSFLNGVASLLDTIFNLLPGFSVDNGKLTSALTTIFDYVKKANKIFPIDTLFTVIGLFVAFSLAMAALWAAMRLINLIRGAG